VSTTVPQGDSKSIKTSDGDGGIAGLGVSILTAVFLFISGWLVVVVRRRRRDEEQRK
jgi:hypothetical protein